MRASRQRKIQADSSHPSLSSMREIDCLLILLFQGATEQHSLELVPDACRVGSCPLQRKMKLLVQTEPKWSPKRSKASCWSVCCSVRVLERASANKVVFQEHRSHHVRTCCFSSETRHVLYGSKDRQDLQYILGLLLLNTNSNTLLARNLYRNRS